MAEQHGGKRTPRNPAPVSGPGKLSRRTDGGPAQVNAQMTGMGYGENKDFMDIQSSAPMAAAGKPRSAAKAPKGGMMGAMGGGNPLFSETQRPNEPVTAGSNVGPGVGSTPPPNNSEIVSRDKEMISQYLPSMMERVAAGGTPEGFNRFVRYLRDMG